MFQSLILLPLHFLARFINTNTYLGDRIKIVPKISRMRKKYSETLPFGHLGNVVTSLLWPLFSAYCGLLVTVLMGFHCKQVNYWPRSVRMEILCPQAVFRTVRGLPSRSANNIIKFILQLDHLKKIVMDETNSEVQWNPVYKVTNGPKQFCILTRIFY